VSPAWESRREWSGKALGGTSRDKGFKDQRRRLGGRLVRTQGAAGHGEQLGADDPGKGWFMILRLYGPLEPWFNKTWRPGEIELQP
jgi:hypothetical protein